MISRDISNHTELLFSEVLRFYLSQSMIAKEIDPYITEDDEFDKKLNKVIEDVKKTMSIVMDDVLGKYEEYYLEARKLLKTQDFI